MTEVVKTIEWTGRTVRLLDQTLLPLTVKMRTINDERAMWDAIKRLVVRGAPAIGVAAAYGLYLGVRRAKPKSMEEFRASAREVAGYLATSRPTAVNLFWALGRCMAVVEDLDDATPVRGALDRLLQEAQAIQRSDEETCAAIGRHGAAVLKGSKAILTHCNTGALATAGIGTALGCIYELAKKQPKIRIFADETRPLLQGARLTAWELQRAGLDVTLITDSMAGTVLQRGLVQAVIVGADRIAANGDTANKIGTMPLAISAKYYGVPFYVAAPLSTIDPNTPNGEAIPVEERGAEEVTEFGGRRMAPKDIKVFAPAFDVTPAKLIAGIVTEVGVLRPPYARAIRAAFKSRD